MTKKYDAANEYGALVPVDRELFISLCKYMADNKLVEELNLFLEKNNCDDVILREDFLNLVKKFLIDSKRTDETARMVISCRCQGSGGPGRPVCGVRG